MCCFLFMRWFNFYSMPAVNHSFFVRQNKLNRRFIQIVLKRKLFLQQAVTKDIHFVVNSTFISYFQLFAWTENFWLYLFEKAGLQKETEVRHIKDPVLQKKRERDKKQKERDKETDRETERQREREKERKRDWETERQRGTCM